MGDGVQDEHSNRGRWAGAGLLVLIALFAASRAQAGPDEPHVEIFSGMQIDDNNDAGYVGAGYAFGKGLYESGWRLRAVTSFGRYNYDSTLPVGAGVIPFTFDGEDTFGAALIGYQFREDHLFVKLFAGIEAEDQDVSPRDPHNSVQGSKVGLKLQEETWLDLSSRTFLSVDASYGTAFREYWSLARFGYRLTPHLALGLEGGALGNEAYNAGRGGGFLRFDVYAMQLTLSGGFTGNYFEDAPSGYFALDIYRAF